MVNRTLYLPTRDQYISQRTYNLKLSAHRKHLISIQFVKPWECKPCKWHSRNRTCDKMISNFKPKPSWNRYPTNESAGESFISSWRMFRVFCLNYYIIWWIHEKMRNFIFVMEARSERSHRCWLIVSHAMVLTLVRMFLLHWVNKSILSKKKLCIKSKRILKSKSGAEKMTPLFSYYSNFMSSKLSFIEKKKF